MVPTLVQDSPSYASVKKWDVRFKRGRDNTEVAPRSGRLKTSTTEGQVDALHRMILDKRRLTVQQIVTSKGI